jgi:Redoxin
MKNHTSYIKYFALVLLCSTAFAQKTRISFQADPNGSCDCTVLLQWYEVRFTEAPAGGLTDSRFESVTSFDPEVDKTLTTSIKITAPQVLSLVILPKSGSISERQAKNKFLRLFVTPNEMVGIRVDASGRVHFAGSTAQHNDFLQDHFVENVYQYLPKLGYNPNSYDNQEVITGIDNLQKKRKEAYQELKQKIEIDSSFNAYVQAEMMTDPYLVREIVASKAMRKESGTKLTKPQDEKLRDYTVKNFKILPDAALLSEGYRSELFNYAMIQVTNKYPVDSAKRWILSDDALKFAYDFTNSYLNDHPNQRQYIHSRWLDYATSLLTNMTTAQELSAKYRQQYPDATEMNAYFETQITGKSKLETGDTAPTFKLKDKDGKEVSLADLKGKKLCLTFCFNLKQHELTLKPTEEKYANDLTFVYINLMSSVPIEYWQTNVAATRTGALYLYASDEVVDKLKNDYLASNPYPFVLIDANGQIVKRWIPQEFPFNKTLLDDLKVFLGK